MSDNKSTNKDCQGALFAIDAHVHLYGTADFGEAISVGRDNLARVARQSDVQPDHFALLLAETARDNAFDALIDSDKPPAGWSISRSDEDPAALWATRDSDAAQVLIVAGRQIVTAERIEVLALATDERFEDGAGLFEILSVLRSKRIPAVIPWGLGKWWGSRGDIVDTALAAPDRAGLLLGDNAGRPLGARTPRQFGLAAKAGVAILPGSDPLPIPRAQRQIGRFGCCIRLDGDVQTPARAFRERLFDLASTPRTIGSRRHFGKVIAEQVALRLQRTRRHAGSPTLDSVTCLDGTKS